MLTSLKPVFLRIKKTFFLNVARLCIFCIAIFYSAWILSASTPNNSSLSAEAFTPTLVPSSENLASPDVSTPEYVIIRPSEEATFSSETTASIQQLNVKEGSTFKVGDILIVMDCRLQKADLQKAKAQQDATSKALASAKKLKEYGSISDFEIVRATADAEAANADVDKLKVVVEKCTIVAPFTGSVAELKIHPHETVKPGDPLLKIVNTEKLIFEIQIPSSWLTWLHEGSKFSVHINDIKKDIKAEVTLINPEIEPISQTVKIIGVITPSDPQLRPGMSGQANFPDNPTKKKAYL